MKKLVRCTLCEKEFESDTVACSDCGLDPKKSPRDAEKVHEIVRIHFDPPGKYEGRGLNHAACDEKIKIGRGRCQMTGDQNVVNCPQCKETDVFKKPVEPTVSADALNAPVVPMDKVAEMADAADAAAKAAE